MTLTPRRGPAARFALHRAMFGRAATVAGVVGSTALVAALTTLSGCSVLDNVAPPSDLVDTSKIQSQTSAVSMYNNGIFNFSRAFGGGTGFSDDSYAGQSGVWADEYTTESMGTIATRDTHTGGTTNEGPMFTALQGARRSITEAIKNLKANGGTAPASYLAEMYALKGYVYLFLSEFYCDGVPFSELNNTGLVEYGDPQTFVEMNTNAIARFDSALAITTDSSRITQLAAVGKGRAYLNLGDFANAKTAVATVSTNFVYAATYAANYYNYLQTPFFGSTYYWMADRDGANGLDFFSSPDTRLAKSIIGGRPFPAKFTSGTSPIPVATGIEARLIEAEAALHANDVPGWAAALNTIRAGAIPAVAALSADSTTTAADTLRVNVMFRERAFWMFGTGHRQGDMRRLIRQYGRLPEKVYGVGVLVLPVPVAYVPVPVADVPQSEIDNNPKYHGCLNRDA